MNKLLIISSIEDATIDYLMPHLERHGIPFVRWDSAALPTQSQASVHWNGNYSWSINSGIEASSLLDVKCGYYRRPGSEHAHPNSPFHTRLFVNSQSREFIRGLFHVFSVPIVCDPIKAGKADVKPLQLKVALACGFSVPETLFSNDPIAIRNFIDAAPGEVVVKSMAAAAGIQKDGMNAAILTNTVKREELDLRSVAAAPAIYQHKIEKEFELRITVIGDEVFAVAIDARNSPLGQHDWRAYDYENTKSWIFDTPDDLKQKCRELLCRYDLLYGAIDVIVTPEGEYFFLEINAFGQWAWLEEDTGIPLADAHCRLFKKLISSS